MNILQTNEQLARALAAEHVARCRADAERKQRQMDEETNRNAARLERQAILAAKQCRKADREQNRREEEEILQWAAEEGRRQAAEQWRKGEQRAARRAEDQRQKAAEEAGRKTERERQIAAEHEQRMQAAEQRRQAEHAHVRARQACQKAVDEVVLHIEQQLRELVAQLEADRQARATLEQQPAQAYTEIIEDPSSAD